MRKDQILIHELHDIAHEAGGYIALAKRLGVPRSTTWRWIHGHNRPSPQLMEKIIRLKHNLPLISDKELV